MRFLLILLVLSLCFYHTSAQKNVTLSGYIREKGSLETLPGVNVYVNGTNIGTSSNNYGFYSITIPEQDKVVFIFSYVGYQKVEKELDLRSNLELNIELETAFSLDEIVVSAEKESKASESVNMSLIELPVEQVKKLPTFLGEKDVLKILQLMPGVQKGTEGQSGLYVRGGGPDQNLLILDDATVYNASHLFGFFSVFNGDALKSVELTKGGFPARFGGRLSSVVEMRMKEGNKKEFHGEGGVGLLSSRLTLEGPILKNKASFLVSARRTYIDIISRPFVKAAMSSEDPKDKGVIGYYFYDLNAKVNYDLSRKDKIYLSGYFGMDKFYLNSEDNSEDGYINLTALLNWRNATSTFRWNHLFNQKLFVNTSLIYSNFKLGINAHRFHDNYTSGKVEDNYTLDYYSGIRDFGLKSDFDYFPNTKHSLKFGLSSIQHLFTPNAMIVTGTLEEFKTKVPDTYNSFETSVYAEDVWQPIQRLKINAGIRLSSFVAEGKTRFRPEPRVSAAYKLSDDLSVKGSFAIMNQFVHLLSNTGIGLPTDLWVPATKKIAPQKSGQVALGLAKDFEKQGLLLTVEGYYKKMKDIISYKEGASFFQFDGEYYTNPSWEDIITTGDGLSYGTEVLLQKKQGKFSGWIGYTLSWTKWQFPELNNGEVFFARFDRRHDISVVGIYEISPKVSLSSTWVYGTGNAMTIPVSDYRFGTLGSSYYFGSGFSYNQEFSKRNAFRAEAYHRLDFAVQFHKKKKKHERTWEFGLFNAYNRRNPFMYQLESKPVYDSKLKRNEYVNVLKRVSLIPILPSISYNFKF